MSIQTEVLCDAVINAFRKHFTFLKKFGYGPPSVLVEDSKVFHQWIQVTSTSVSVNREIIFSLSTDLPMGDRGSAAIDIIDEPLQGQFSLFANLSLEDITGTAPDWSIDLTRTTNDIDGLLKKCALEMQKHCVMLLNGQDWEIGYFYPKD